MLTLQIITGIFFFLGEQPFECNVCHKHFSQRANMQKHMLVHTGQKPFQCGVCEKEFSQQANLKKHMQVHIGKLYI